MFCAPNMVTVINTSYHHEPPRHHNVMPSPSRHNARRRRGVKTGALHIRGRAGLIFKGERISYSSESHIAGGFHDLEESRLHIKAAALEYKTRARALR